MNDRLPDTLGFELRVLNEKMDYLKSKEKKKYLHVAQKF